MSGDRFLAMLPAACSAVEPVAMAASLDASNRLMLTFLRDASDRGTRFIVRCQVDRVLIEAGRAVGVEGWALDEATGVRRKVVVHAPLVVVSGWIGGVAGSTVALRSDES